MIGVKYFNAIKGCQRCTVTGKRVERRTVFLDCDANERTHHSFIMRTDKLHHVPKFTSQLERIKGIDMIHSFIITDELHTLHLGVCKKLISRWSDDSRGEFNGIRYAKWNSHQINEMSTYMDNVKLPLEFNRQPRSIKDFRMWKGTELRSFLMYISIPILSEYLPETTYNHFLLLFCAMHILSSKSLMSSFLNLAKGFLVQYCSEGTKIYGNTLLISNFHNLIHLVDDLKMYNCTLNECSSYEFENRMDYVKKMIRTGHSMLVQLVHRTIEINNSAPQLSIDIKKKKIHDKRIELKGKTEDTYVDYSNDDFEKYRSISLISFRLKNDNLNCYFYSDIKPNCILKFEMAVVNKKTLKTSIIYTFNSIVYDYFEKPIPSSSLHIYKMYSKQFSDEFYECEIESVQFKFVNLPMPLQKVVYYDLEGEDDDFFELVIPMAHTT